MTISSLSALSVPGISAITLCVLRSSSLKRRLDLDGELHRDLLLQHPRDQVVVLRREDDRRHRVGALIASGDEQRAVLADVRLDRHADAFGLQHREPLGVELRRPTGRGSGGFRSPLAAGRSARIAYCWIGLVNRMAPFSFPACAFIAASSRPGIHTGVATMRPAVDGDQPCGYPIKRHVARLDHLDRDLVERPAAAELERLGVHLAQAHRLHLFLRPRDRRACARASWSGAGRWR